MVYDLCIVGGRAPIFIEFYNRLENVYRHIYIYYPLKLRTFYYKLCTIFCTPLYNTDKNSNM